MVKNPPCNAGNAGLVTGQGAKGLPQQLVDKERILLQCRRHRRCRFDSWVRKIPWRRAWQPTPVVLTGKSHGQGSLAGYSPWGHKRVGHDLAPKQQEVKLNCY